MENLILSELDVDSRCSMREMFFATQETESHNGDFEEVRTLFLTNKNAGNEPRKPRTEIAAYQASISILNANIYATALGVAKNPIPKDVLEIYQRYNSLKEVLLDTKDVANRVKNATLLIKHNLFKPDEEGLICKLALVACPPCLTLELIHYCLPNREYLQNHPKYLDELREISLKHKFIPEDVISFLSDRDKVKNCPERDDFFYRQYLYEMKMAGASEGENFADFLLRKKLPYSEYNLLISKLPIIIRKHLNQQWQFIKQAIQDKNLEGALFCLEKKIVLPSFYANPDPNFFFGLCHEIIKSHRAILMGYPTNIMTDLIKNTFPSREYCEANKKNLNEFLTGFALECVDIRIHFDKTCALEIFSFISENCGVNLNDLEKICNNPGVTKFLKNNGFLN